MNELGTKMSSAPQTSSTPLPANLVRPVPARAPRLLVEWASPRRQFLENLADFLLRRTPTQPRLTSAPAPFWPDVFVERRPPWRSIARSVAYHAIVLPLAIWSAVLFWTAPRIVSGEAPREHATLHYYDESEYLPPLAAASKPAPKPRKGAPELAKQPIVSMPADADNSTQTIITPPKVKLPREVPLPNLMVWTEAPAPPVMSTQPRLTLPKVALDIIAPRPETRRDLSQLRSARVQPEIMEPKPDLQASVAERNVPRVEVEIVAAAPRIEGPLAKLNLPQVQPTIVEPAPAVSRTVDEATRNAGSPIALSPTIATPDTPDISGAGLAARPQGQIVALSVRPGSAEGPIQIPEGNRRGVFAASPEGTPGAPGTPDIKAGGNGPGGEAAGPAAAGNVNGSPELAGISIGGSPDAPLMGTPGQPRAVVQTARPAETLRAEARPSADAARTAAPTTAPATPEERQVFGARRIYQMALNMPNFSSGGGGSYIIRFAEGRGPAPGTVASSASGDLSAPVPKKKYDPAYPAAAVRERIQGTVVLYAIIKADGTVSDVRVIYGVNERLDESAKLALSRWIFAPATKNGVPVDLEAVVQVPFRIGRVF